MKNSIILLSLFSLLLVSACSNEDVEPSSEVSEAPELPYIINLNRFFERDATSVSIVSENIDDVALVLNRQYLRYLPSDQVIMLHDSFDNNEYKELQLTNARNENCNFGGEPDYIAMSTGESTTVNVFGNDGICWNEVPRLAAWNFIELGLLEDNTINISSQGGTLDLEISHEKEPGLMTLQLPQDIQTYR